MASATHVLTDFGSTNITYTLVGSSNSGAAYKNATRSLALPQSLDFAYTIGNPGSKGNDHLKITLKDVVENSDTGLISTGSCTVDVSVPRDSAWEAEKTEDLLAQMSDLLSSTASLSMIADAIVP